MTKYTEKIYILLTTLSKIFDSKTFDIHRDTIAKLLHTDNRIVTQCMRSLKGKHGVIDFNMADEMEYTVTMIEPSKDICDDVMKYSKEDIKKMDETSLSNYKKLLEEQKMREEETQHEGLQRFLEEKREEQIDNGNKAENALKTVFDELGITYDYQHIEIIKDDECKEHGYIYDFLIEIDGTKYDIEVDGSSHDGKEEQDKERDELSMKIGIYPRRFSIQIVYTIYDEVFKGMITKKKLSRMITLGCSSIDKMVNVVDYFNDCANKFHRRNLDYEFKNLPILDSRERLGSSLMNDEDNKYIDSIKGVLSKKICGEHGEVIYEGKIIPTVTCETPFTTVTCGTNGYKGGDWGHGSRTYVKVEGSGLNGYQIRKIDEDKEGASNGYEIAVGGDLELDSMIETFEAIASNLKKMKKEISKDKAYGILNKLNNSSERKEVFEILKKEFDNEEEHDSLFDAKEKQKVIRDEMARECFLLSKKDAK